MNAAAGQVAHRAAIALVVGCAALVLATPSPAGAQEAGVVPVVDLLGDGSAHDGHTITVEGELVGDYGYRGDGSMWTQLNDDPYARHALVEGGALAGGNVGVGVRIPDDLAADLDPVGGYRLTGPLVRLTGRWLHHDPSRGGESYLDVTHLEVVAAGRRIEEGTDWLVLAVGLVFVGAAAALWRRRPPAPDV